MAEMLPRVVAENTASDAERRLFRLIRDELSDDWCAIHSLGMTSHARKPWAEIDFVLIGPPGVFCLEVKGGRIGRHEGRWTTTNRHEKTSTLRESPMSQVGSAAAALHKFLTGRLSVMVEAVTGYGVATPDCVFDISGPDIEPTIVYDGHDVPAGFGTYVDRLSDYWSEQAKTRWARTPVELSAADRRAVRDALVKDFELRPSLRSSIASIRDQFIRYTAEQVAVLQGLRSNPRVLVHGTAGTGKTVLAAEEAFRLASEGNRTLLTCYNRRLAKHLRELQRGTKLLTIVTLHSLMAQVIHEAGLQGRIPDAEPTDLFRMIIPELCLEAVLDGRTEREFDAVVVDEGQDLLSEAYVDVLDSMLVGGLAEGQWRVFCDPNQDVYSSIGLLGVRRLNETKPTRFELTVNCRNAKKISVTSSLLSGLPTPTVLRVDGGDVETIFVSGDADQRRKVSKAIGSLIHKGVDPQEIIVLSPKTLQRSCLRGGLVGRDTPLLDLDEVGDGPAGAIRFSTIASFKGLEADAVLLVDLADLSSDRFAGDAYVGSTRAHAYLAIFIPEGERASFDRRAKDFGRMEAAAT